MLNLEHRGISGHSLGELLDKVDDRTATKAISTLQDPVGPPGALIVLRGSLAPDGAIIKPAAATKELLVHEGPALVFESADDAARRIDDPDLRLTPDHVLVLRNAGPIGAAMPEAGSMKIPKPQADRGVRDIVRISDARMSGTSYGTVVLHCSPEGAAGGPLATVRDDDRIRLDVPARRLDLLVDDSELRRRREAWRPSQPPARGWRRLYAESVLPASEGADLAFLTGARAQA